MAKAQPICKINTNNTETSEDDNCPICLEPNNDDESIEIPCCKNRFHSRCYRRWIKVKSNCPLCRSEEYATLICIVCFHLQYNNHYEFQKV